MYLYISIDSIHSTRCNYMNTLSTGVGGGIPACLAAGLQAHTWWVSPGPYQGVSPGPHRQGMSQGPHLGGVSPGPHPGVSPGPHWWRVCVSQHALRQPPPPRLLLRAVRILLECILVHCTFHFINNGNQLYL